jgi:hypothetical protein
MDPAIIVMITLLALPNGDNGVHIKPFNTVAACAEEAEIEVSDPFVAHVECSELINGNITLNFKKGVSKPTVQSQSKAGF